MFLQFSESVLGRTRSTRKNSVRVTEFFGIGIRRTGAACLPKSITPGWLESRNEDRAASLKETAPLWSV